MLEIFKKLKNGFRKEEVAEDLPPRKLSPAEECDLLMQAIREDASFQALKKSAVNRERALVEESIGTSKEPKVLE